MSVNSESTSTSSTSTSSSTSSTSTSSTSSTSTSSTSLDEDSSCSQIVLKSMSGENFTLTRRDCCISDLVKTAIDGDSQCSEISLNVKKETLELIVEYMKKKGGETSVCVSKPLKSTMIDSCLPSGKWEAEFIDMVYLNKERLHDLVLASNYMLINPLLQLSCARVALGLKGKTKRRMEEELRIS
jgi:hypothetical protein